MLIAIEKAEESDRLKTAFLANLSHEIRTPMNGIMGFSDLLAEAENPEDKERYAEIVQRSCDQLLSIINNILDISKIEANKITLVPELVNINDIFQYQLDTFEKQAQIKHVNVTFEPLPDGEAGIKTDKAKLNQVLSNLIDNAIKYTNRGLVKFGAFKQDHHITFFVKDTGIGIQPNDQIYIFDRFRQVDERASRNFDGLGIGLSISKSYIEAMGGKIGLESEEEKGTTVKFTLPLA